MAWKTDDGSPISPWQCYCPQVCGSNGCCAWLWLWTGWSPSILSQFGTIWLFFCSPIMKKTPLCWEAVSDRWWGHISSVENFFEDQDESFYSNVRNPSAITPMEEVCGPQGRLDMYDEKYTTFSQIRPLHHSQPTNFSAHPRICMQDASLPSPRAQGGEWMHRLLRLPALLRPVVRIIDLGPAGTMQGGLSLLFSITWHVVVVWGACLHAI